MGKAAKGKEGREKMLAALAAGALLFTLSPHSSPCPSMDTLR